MKFYLGLATVKEIDELNILEATKLSMKRVIDKFEEKNISIIIDGNFSLEYEYINEKSIIGGDKKSDSGLSYSYNSKEEVTLLGKDILFIKKESDFHKKDESFNGSSIFYLLIMLPLVSLGGFIFLLSKNRSLYSNKALLRRSKAGKVAKKHLKKASQYLNEDNSVAFYDALSNGVIGYLGNKFNIDLSDSGKENTKKILKDHKIDNDTISEIISFIELCEIVRYAPTSISDSMNESLIKAEQIIEKIDTKI